MECRTTYAALVLLACTLSLPAVMASCDPGKGLSQLTCSKGFVDGKQLSDLQSVTQQLSGCVKLLLAQCTTFQGLGHTCTNPACDPQYASLSSLPQFMYPARRAMMCTQDTGGCALYMPRAQLCTVCQERADAALKTFGQVFGDLARLYASQRHTILQSPGRRSTLAAAQPGDPTYDAVAAALADDPAPPPLGKMKGKLDTGSAPVAQPKMPAPPSGRGLTRPSSQGPTSKPPPAAATAPGPPPAQSAVVRQIGDVAGAMATMDAFDEPVRQSINSPVPQGDTFAKFGSVRNGIWWKPAKEGPHSHVTDPWNNFDPKSAEFTPAPTSNKPFPTNALVEATLSLQERDPQKGAEAATNLQKLNDEVYKTMKSLGFTLFDFQKVLPSNQIVWGYDPKKYPIRGHGQVLGKWADQVLPGIGSAVQKFSDALSDTVSKFAANNKENKAAAAAAARGEAPGPSKSPFLATPTSFLSWFVDYQQTMQCYYMCLGYVLDCLKTFTKAAPDCHEICRSSHGVEVLTNTKAQQIERFSKGCK